VGFHQQHTRMFGGGGLRMDVVQQQLRGIAFLVKIP